MRRRPNGLFRVAVMIALGGPAMAQVPTDNRLSGMTAPMHDPVLIREGRVYHVYGTGQRGQILSARVSDDLIDWRAGTPPFTHLPDWATLAVPGAKGMWAPDIAYVNGRYRLYYSVSTFGSRRSAIGLATSATLDPAAPGYGWRDEGMVVRSMPADDYNAIDPNFIADRDGRHWLAFGSFWGGLKLVALDPVSGKPSHPEAVPLSIARRPEQPGGGNPVEAPFLIDHGGWYWLIASYDYCCRGADSSYYTVVGRAKAITGPYRDRQGRAMMAGGGTILLRADAGGRDRFRGPGHAGVFRDRNGTDQLVYHAYDRDRGGISTLRLARIRWGADGWPVAE